MVDHSQWSRHFELLECLILCYAQVLPPTWPYAYNNIACMRGFLRSKNDSTLQ